MYLVFSVAINVYQFTFVKKNCIFVLQKQNKYSENKLKALKARNDYLLCIESANAAVGKYFSDDISDLIDVRDATPCHIKFSLFTFINIWKNPLF